MFRLDPELIIELREKLDGKIITNEPMSKHTSYKIGGPATLFAIPESRDDLLLLLETAKEVDIPRFHLGGGSNILVHDKGYPGLVIDVRAGFKNLSFDKNRVIAGSGLSLAKFVSECRKHNLSGVESLAGIPGSLGGALYMNAGAFGSEISNKLRVLTILTDEGEFKDLKAVELQFAYRESNLPENSLIIEALFEMTLTSDADEIYEKSKEILKSRKEKQPTEYPSPGSIFKNPEEHSAGKLIEDAGLKGRRSGGAMISEKHANFIINTGRASSEDVVHLIALAQKEVFSQFDIELELEIKLIGFDEWYI